MKPFINLLMAFTLSMPSAIFSQTIPDSLHNELNVNDISTGILYDKCIKLGGAITIGTEYDSIIDYDNIRQLLLEMKTCNVNQNASIITLDSLTTMLNADVLNHITPIVL